MSDISGVKMKYRKILMCMTALFCLAPQVFAESDPLSESPSSSEMGSSGDWISPNMGQATSTNLDEGQNGMVQLLDQPVPDDAAKSTATSTTPNPDATKSTTTTTSAP